MLLAAATHYATQAGGLRDYEQTYRYHMAETISQLNRGITKSHKGSHESLAACGRLITALCVVETRIGNLRIAKAHLDGLLAMMDLVASQMVDEDSSRTSADFEHLERCMMLGDTFLSGLWDHASDPSITRCRTWPVQKYHIHYMRERDEHLQALGLISYYINKLPVMAGPAMIDANGLIQSARWGNILLRERKFPGSMQEESASMPDNLLDGDAIDALGLIMANGAADLLTWFGNITAKPANVKTHKPTSDFVLEALPFYVAAGQYYRRILELRPTKPDDTTEIRIQWRKLGILKRGIQRAESDMIAGKINRDIWFWEAFVGLLGNEIFGMQIGKFTQQTRSDPRLGEFRSWFAERVRRWAKICGVTKWRDAQKILLSVVWPESPGLFPHADLAEWLWFEAIHSTY
ncbi:hypothetical protein GQ53DRAFT_812919 [Thozetella sp. PMI_491]|nr:hypothetical protein GQ53DRAFT_812919 [Thozetella sp. PMI_491]